MSDKLVTNNSLIASLDLIYEIKLVMHHLPFSIETTYADRGVLIRNHNF